MLLHHRLGPGSQGGTAEREQSEPQTAGRPRTRLVLKVETQISIRDGGEMPERVIEVPDVLGRCALLWAERGARARRPTERVVDVG